LAVDVPLPLRAHLAGTAQRIDKFYDDPRADRCERAPFVITRERWADRCVGPELKPR